MQLNIYVPAEKAALLKNLDRTAQLTGRSKNELVLEALEKYLSSAAPEPGRYSLGAVKLSRRADLYDGRLG